MKPIQNQTPPHRLAAEPLRGLIERFVSGQLGKQWTIQALRDMHDFACHPSAILSDGSYSVFAKLSEAPNGAEQFEIELAGLRRLQELAGVLIPEPLGILPTAEGSLLIMQSVPEIERGPRQWREIGATLARIHRVKGDSLGLETNGYFGPLPQDNTPMCDWPAFYAARRLIPGLKMAVDSGHLPVETARQVESALEINFPSAQRLIDQLVQAGLLREITGGRRNRVYRADEILKILESV